MKCSIALALLSCTLLVSTAAHASETRYVEAGEVPTPIEVARALAGADFQPKLRRRGISMDHQNAPAATMLASAATGTAAASAAASAAAPTAATSAPRPSGGGTLAVAIAFDFNSSELQPQALAQLDSIAEGLKLIDNARIQIEGHTDAVGSAAYNQALSERRAAAVKQYLVNQHAMNGAALLVEGRGMSQPLAGVDPAAAPNRRVAFRLN